MCLETLYTSEAIQQLISENEMTLIFFGSKSCNVCSAIKPKIEEILKDYPKIKGAQVDVEKSPQAAAGFHVFTIPVIAVYIEEKEMIREARYVSLEVIRDKIERYHSLLFGMKQ